MRDFIIWLTERHNEIMACEKAALAALDNDDKSLYTEKMREKATRLRDLHKQAVPHLQNLPENLREAVEQPISRFSSSAAMGLSLNSPFYMSALLYRDDHKAEEPDNLAVFIESLKKI